MPTQNKVVLILAGATALLVLGGALFLTGFFAPRKELAGLAPRRSGRRRLSRSRR